jgi:transketolase
VAYEDGLHRVIPIRPGATATVLAVGPMLDRVLAATSDLDVCVAYTATSRPLDGTGLRALTGRDLVIVEPYLAGTSAYRINEILSDRPHRLLSLGVQRVEHRRYGTIDDHHRLHGLDVAGIRRAILTFLDTGS